MLRMDALFGKGVMVVRVFRIGIFGCENCLFLLHFEGRKFSAVLTHGQAEHMGPC